MTVEVGGIYQSRGFPHIQRKVLGFRLEGQIVVYSIIDLRQPEGAFRKAAEAVLSEFEKVSVGLIMEEVCQ